MRTIKFRGMTEDKKWVYGYYCQVEERHYIVLENAQIIPSDSPVEGFIEVIPETVGQFTGLHDNKRTKEYPEGQEIYEEDIVKLDTPKSEFHKTRNLKIIFNQKFAQFCIDPCTSISHWPSVEVIGNVHSNPELIEK